jgi:hypothetical protein
MDGSAQRAPALSALKAAQASLAEDLTRLRVASAARPPTPLVGEGESVARGFGVLPVERGEATGGGLLSSLFFWGGWVPALFLEATPYFRRQAQGTLSRSSRAWKTK